MCTDNPVIQRTRNINSISLTTTPTIINSIMMITNAAVTINPITTI